jgi:hypothetical protein
LHPMQVRYQAALRPDSLLMDLDIKDKVTYVTITEGRKTYSICER